MNAIVTLSVVAMTADEKRLAITARIDQPLRQEDGSWLCQVEVAPLQEQVLNVRGVDSFHAVWLSCSLILKLLTHLEQGGARLLNEDGSVFPLHAYLAGLEEKPDP
jgi:hypothetical protein